MYDMCTSDLSFWTMVLGHYLILLVWYVYIRSFLLNYGFLASASFFMYDMCTSDFSSWTMVSWSLPGLSCMICVHQIFPSELWFFGLYLILHVWHVYIRSELWFLGLYLVLHVWHVYIRSFLLNYGFLVNLLPHVWHVYIRSFLLNYGFFISTWSFMYDMCTSDLSFWTMVSWSLPASSCMTCVHQIFLLNYGFLVSTWSSFMTCVHQNLSSVLWFLGLYLVLHVLYV